jgi:catechol 2,3-dioxygenase-like lactoylglutathione lyase family enzyme
MRMTRLHHMGITVNDLDEAVAFYQPLCGGDLAGPYEKSGPSVDAATGYPGVVVRQAFLTFPGGDAVLELLEYRGGSGLRIEPDNGSVGAAHPAIVVDDLDATLARLAARGTRALSAPMIASAGPLEGHRYVYVLGPDDVRVELLEPPR